MTELFNPDFTIQIKCDKDIEEIISQFRAEFESIITKWQGSMGQSESYYFHFQRDRAFEKELTQLPYELLVAGKGEWEEKNKQEQHKALGKPVYTPKPFYII